MTDRLRPERETQNRVINLFKTLDYTYLGNWTKRPGNSAVEFSLLEAFLKRNGVSAAQISTVQTRIDQARAVLHQSLYEANRRVYELLRYGVQVATAVGQPNETVHLIDWEHPENNDFAIAEEVTLDQGGDVRRPDLVLYLNGFAVGVIELKRSSVNVGDGIRQLITNQQDNPYFFVAAQLLFAGNDTEGLLYGTCLTKEQFFVRWKEKQEQPSTDPGCHLDVPLSQMCKKSRLLDFIHDCIIFDGGIKKVPRPHQYFGFKAAQERIRRREGGVIWHTQGSGKTILMVMLAKWITEYSPRSRVLIVTDRTELDTQASGVMANTGATDGKPGDSLVASRRRAAPSLRPDTQVRPWQRARPPCARRLSCAGG